MSDKFNPQQYIVKIQGRDYLQVKDRIRWFRSEHPGGSIKTEIAITEPIVIRADIFDAEGHHLGSGHGSPKIGGVAGKRPFEGAETAAIGRALACAGYGTQFTGDELDEGEDLADAPVEKAKVSAPPVPGDDTKQVVIMGGDTIKHVVSLGIFEAEQAAAQVLARLFPGQTKAPLRKIVDTAKLYRSNKAETGDTDKAIELTIGAKDV